MTIEVKVPELPESVSEATVGEWLKAPGNAVQRDENLLDLETDKVVLEVPAVADGKLAEIKVESGATVQAGDVLAIIEEGAAGDGGDASDDSADDDSAAEEASENKAAGESQSASDDSAAASPAADKLMAEQNLTAGD